MMFLSRFLLTFVVTFGIASGAHAAISDACSSYTDCDELVACELYEEVEKAMSGLSADYNGAVARAASYLNKCSNYPDLFAKNIDVNLSDDPYVQLTIDWSAVRNRMRYGSQGGFTSEDMELVEDIAALFSPADVTAAQKKFFEALATAYINANRSDPTSRLDDAFVLNFLGEDDNFAKYRNVVRDLTGTVQDEDYGIDVDWDEVLVNISIVLDKAEQKRSALVCENHRSIQAGIDVFSWVATAVAAIFTIYAGGAGGVAVAGVKAAVGTGLKAAAKGVAKAGGKAAAKRMAKSGTKMVAKSAIKLGLKKDLRGLAIYKGKGVVKTAAKRFVKQAGKNLATKKGVLLAGGALVTQIGKSAVKNNATGLLYSLVESGLSKDIVNCTNLDKNEGCYTVCGYGNGDDDLNTKVFNVELKKSYCVNPDDYALYEINPDGSRGTLLVMEPEKWNAIKRRIKTQVADKGKCDWNEDDIDMYAGFMIYDPDTLEISDQDMVIDDFIRIDD